MQITRALLLRKSIVWEQMFIRGKQIIYMVCDSLNGVLNSYFRSSWPVLNGAEQFP